MQLAEGQILKEIEIDGKKVTLRIPAKDDVGELMEYINSLIDEGAKILLKEKVTKENEEKFLEGLLKSINDGIRFYICVECNGKIVGSAQVEKKMKERNVNEHISEMGIAITKDFRNKGLGTILMEMLLSHAKNEFKSELVKITVYSDNEPALKLYKKLGFREVGRVPKGVKYKDKYADEIIMIKELV